jgi:hypothetical protein
VLRRLLIPALLALALAASASAQEKSLLMPGVTYERGVQFTPHGPVALHVVTGPRPTGLYALRPVLSNNSILGRETVTSMQKRVSREATVVGTNGDLFSWETGRPSGILMRGRVLDSAPLADRSSVGITSTGELSVQRVSFFGTWSGLGRIRSLTDINEEPDTNGVSLFTPVWGDRTPAVKGAVQVVLDGFPAAAAEEELPGFARSVVRGESAAIPRNGAVLVGRGTGAATLLREAPVGAEVFVRLILRPSWEDVTDAVGGGPEIVRNGVPVFQANEAFTESQLGPRNPRTAIGQRRDGRILMVVTDGRQPGYSVGMTNFELGQTLARLGAVTASALDAGGSTTLAFDGTLLNQPSDPGGERSVSTALMLMYFGIVLQEPERSVVSPNGDGRDERETLRFKIVRPSSVTITMEAPDGSVAWTETVDRAPGRYRISFPAPPPPPVPPPAPPPPPAPVLPPPPVPPPAEPAPPVEPPPPTEPPPPAEPPPPTEPPPATPPPPPAPAPPPPPAPAPPPPPAPVSPPPAPTSTTRTTQFNPDVVDTSEGRWRVTVEATDETGLVSRMTRIVKVNLTLGFLRTTPRRLYLPPQGRELEIAWQLRHAARVRVTIEALDGTVVKAYPMRRYRRGERSVVWNGLSRDGKPVKGGLYFVKVLARNNLGTVELDRKLGVQRIAGPPRPRP